MSKAFDRRTEALRTEIIAIQDGAKEIVDLIQDLMFVANFKPGEGPIEAVELISTMLPSIMPITTKLSSRIDDLISNKWPIELDNLSRISFKSISEFQEHLTALIKEIENELLDYPGCFANFLTVDILNNSAKYFHERIDNTEFLSETTKASLREKFPADIIRGLNHSPEKLVSFDCVNSIEVLLYSCEGEASIAPYELHLINHLIKNPGYLYPSNSEG